MNHGGLVAGDMERKLSQRHDLNLYPFGADFLSSTVCSRSTQAPWLQDSSATPHCERDSVDYGCLACSTDVRVLWWLLNDGRSRLLSFPRNESCPVRWFVGSNLARSRISVALGRVLDFLRPCLPWLFVYPNLPSLKITIKNGEVNPPLSCLSWTWSYQGYELECWNPCVTSYVKMIAWTHSFFSAHKPRTLLFVHFFLPYQEIIKSGVNCVAFAGPSFFHSCWFGSHVDYQDCVISWRFGNSCANVAKQHWEKGLIKEHLTLWHWRNSTVLKQHWLKNNWHCGTGETSLCSNNTAVTEQLTRWHWRNSTVLKRHCGQTTPEKQHCAQTTVRSGTVVKQHGGQTTLEKQQHWSNNAGKHWRNTEKQDWSKNTVVKQHWETRLSTPPHAPHPKIQSDTYPILYKQTPISLSFYTDTCQLQNYDFEAAT